MIRCRAGIIIMPATNLMLCLTCSALPPLCILSSRRRIMAASPESRPPEDATEAGSRDQGEMENELSLRHESDPQVVSEAQMIISRMKARAERAALISWQRFQNDPGATLHSVGQSALGVLGWARTFWSEWTPTGYGGTRPPWSPACTCILVACTRPESAGLFEMLSAVGDLVHKILLLVMAEEMTSLARLRRSGNRCLTGADYDGGPAPPSMGPVRAWSQAAADTNLISSGNLAFSG